MINLFLSLFIFFMVGGINLSITESIVKTHSPYGLPENEVFIMKDFLILRKQYIVFYNEKINMTNFVVYNLDKSWFGEVTRYDGKFLPDTLLNKLNLKKINHNSYTNTGYERGHLVRSEERSLTEQDNKSTFYLTNILPQTPDVNSGVWYNLEKFCEKLCKVENKNLYIIAGGIFKPNYKLGDLTIPSSLFKIVLIEEKDLSKSKMVAVIIPNVKGVKKKDWIEYVTNVDDIEKQTGYNFFPLMNEEIQNKLEKEIYVR